MSGVKLRDISGLRDRLVRIKFVQALEWECEDLDQVIHSKSSSWHNLLKWLLERLSNDSIIGDAEKIKIGVQKSAVGLGICNSIQAEKLVLGDASYEEKIEFLSHLIGFVELMSEEDVEDIKDKNTQKMEQILDGLSEVTSSIEDMNLNQTLGATKKKCLSQSSQDLKKVESYVEDNSILQKRVAEAKEELEHLRKELGLEEGVTADDAILQLKRERKDICDKTAMVAESLKLLISEAKHIYETELSSLLPVDVADPMDLTVIDSMAEKVECISQAQNVETTIENCATTLRNKTFNECPGDNWSTKEVSSLTLFQLYEDSQNALID